MTEKVRKTEAEWREQLTDEQYGVARLNGTEAAFTGRYHDCKDAGTYRCVCCGNELFRSESKFDSGTGWPSFSEPIRSDSVETESDDSFGMRRTAVLCSRCEAHLGHLFNDGPQPTGMRYCLNSAALELEPDEE